MSEKSEVIELGNYRVLLKAGGGKWKLGSGGFGTTYKAEHKHLPRTCALKVINDDLLKKGDAKQRFLQEAQAASLLEHPNIAHIYDFGESDGVFYYAMTFCGGGDLEEYCKIHGPSSWSQIRKLVQQMFSALDAAHSKGLLHRDIKPQNIMLMEPKNLQSVRLIDFGLVKVLAEKSTSHTHMLLTKDGGFMGSPLTASPEQLREEELDERSDLFSLGVTIWFLLCGQSPFEGVATAQLVHNRLSEESYDSMFDPEWPEEAKQILSKLLTKDREDRFATAKQVLQALEDPSEAIYQAPETATAPTTQAAPASVPETATTIVNTPEDVDWEQIWSIDSVQHQLAYGSYYRCTSLGDPAAQAVSIFVPEANYQNFQIVQENARKLIGAESDILNSYLQQGTLSGQTAYLSLPYPAGDVQLLIQQIGDLDFMKFLHLFQLIAKAVDEAQGLDIPGVELSNDEIKLAFSNQDSARSPESWSADLRSRISNKESFIDDLSVFVMPKLEDFTDLEEVSVTLSCDDLATSPISRFAGFIYSAVSGMTVRQSAYLSPNAHVSTSNLSEESNRYIASILSAREIPDTALEFLGVLAECEGTSWDEDSLDASKSMRADQLAHISVMRSSVAHKKKSAKQAPGISISTSKSTSKPAVTIPPLTTTSAADSSSSSLVQEIPSIESQAQKPAPAAIKQKSNKKKLVLIVSLLTLLIGGVSYYFISKPDNKRTRKSRGITSSDNGSSTPVSTPAVTPEDDAQVFNLEKVSLDVGDNPTSFHLFLVDYKGAAIGKISTNTSGTLQVILETKFAEIVNWPLKLTLKQEGFSMKPIIMRQSDFIENGDSAWDYDQSVKIKINQLFTITPRIIVDGKPVKNSSIITKKYLQPKDISIEWSLDIKDDRIVITLPLNTSLPVAAKLSIPYFKSQLIKLDKQQSYDWKLKLLTKKITLAGANSVLSAKFKANIDTIQDIDLKKVLNGMVANYRIIPASNDQGMLEIDIPHIAGEMNLHLDSGKHSFTIGRDSLYIVLSKNSLNTSSPSTDPEFLRVKDLAELGHTDEQNALAEKYHDGNGTPRDLSAWYYWSLLAAKNGEGNVSAINNLGRAYSEGIGGVDKNYSIAVKYYKQAVRLKSADAMFNLAGCYEYGDGVGKDIDQAVKLYKDAIALDNSRAMFNMAVIHGNKLHSKYYSIPKSIDFYQMAAEKNHTEACFNLGVIYLQGMGVTKDRKKALAYLKKAADSKHPQAKELYNKFK